jgi:excisionase family DNA binding protein
MQTTSNSQRLLRRPEARERLGIGLSTYKRLVGEGSLREVGIGRARRLPEGEVARYISARLKESAVVEARNRRGSASTTTALRGSAGSSTATSISSRSSENSVATLTPGLFESVGTGVNEPKSGPLPLAVIPRRYGLSTPRA